MTQFLPPLLSLFLSPLLPSARILARGFLIFAMGFSVAMAKPIAAAAQDDDDFVILGEEDDDVAGTAWERLMETILDYADRYAYGNIGGFYGGGTSTERSLFAARFGVDYPFRLSDWMPDTRIDMQGRLRLELGYGARRVQITQELDCPAGPCQTDPSADNYRDLEREIKINTSEFELREAYGEIEPLPNLVVAFGRQRPIWGQFDIFSVVNLLLPIEFQSNEFGLGKQTYRMPQDVLTVTWFPMSRVEVQAYYFLGTTLDPLHLEAIQGNAQSTQPFYVPGVAARANNIRDSYRNLYPYVVLDGCSDNAASDGTNFCNASRPDTKPEEEQAFAFRALYYGRYATLGFTYHNGVNSFGASDQALVSRICANSSGEIPSTGCGANNATAFNVLERTGLADSQSFGLEVAVPYGRWNWKAEFVYRDTEADLADVYTQQVSNFDSFFGSSADRLRYYNWLVDNNGGRGYVSVQDLWFMFGFDADYDRWNFGAAIVYNTIMTSGESDEAERLRKAAYPLSDDDRDIDQSFPPFPTVYLTYATDAEKNHIVGIAGGVLGPILGVTAFYTGSWRDDFDWTGALEFQQTVSDNYLSDSNEGEGGDGSRYELKDGISFGGRVGLVWRF